MKILRWSELDEAARKATLRRPERSPSTAIADIVRRIVEQVRVDGDGALRALTRRYDNAELGDFAVDAAEFAQAEREVTPELLAAMRDAYARLVTWHEAGRAQEFDVETAEGVRCGRMLRGIGRVGLYVPAGSAPLPSTALMLGVPARLAGCERIVLCTPPRSDGRADPAVLMAARLCGIDEVFKIGGAQAIAAMALGTESVPVCDKLFGPGNAYVAAAKQYVSGLPQGPAIDLPAGPSEVLVIADAGANPRFVAADLLSQAEHGEDSQVVLLSESSPLLQAVAVEIEAQLPALPRADIARAALAHARGIQVERIELAFDISNAYAPEHLILALRQPRDWLASIRAAGSVFLGDYAPEALGDYCSGTNHVLPTDAAARAWSGLGLASFQIAISLQEVNRSGLMRIGPCAVTLARAEGLEAHAQAVLRRLESAT
ncbi:histidinol dehydrogenase [Arenimonas sp.]|uniref:histidinol dehydrogenase n=1 Tax=Arenimonas sp. TaxID=1872635 RepID=UPI0039E21AFB